MLSGPTRVIVDLDAVRHNLQAVRRLVGPDCRIAAVVKADGYGHGSIPVARAVLDAGADMLCVAVTQEGVELRRSLPDASILVFGTVFPDEVDAVVESGLVQTVDDEAMLPHFDRAAASCGRQARLHLKVDTGMSRLGVWPEEALPFMRQAARCRHVRLEGIYSHFANSDARDQTFARRQLALFREVVEDLEAHGFSFEVAHIANSAAVLSMPESHLDMVRPGIMIYGLRPAPRLGDGLRPAMAVVSRITRLKLLPARTPVGYGCTWQSDEPRGIATIPIGYADGYRRQLSNGFHVLVRGQKAPVVGRVCMDMLMADVTDVAGAAKGDDVLIFGRIGGDWLPAEEMAAAAGTIPYEIVTGIGPRVPRVYGTP